MQNVIGLWVVMLSVVMLYIVRGAAYYNMEIITGVKRFIVYAALSRYNGDKMQNGQLSCRHVRYR
jgi:hypothetical protein